MAGPDLSVFGRQKSLIDQQQLQSAFEQQKQLQALQAAGQLATINKTFRGGDLPAPIQIANEIARRQAAGDTDGANLLAQTSKIYDRGVQVDPTTGAIVPMLGYGSAIGQIGATKAGMEEQAKSNVNLAMDPLITRANSNQKNQSDVNFAAELERQKAIGDAQGGQEKTNMDKSQKAINTLGILDEIEKKDDAGKTLLEKATGSGFGAKVAATKGFVGKSDESTQANAQLVFFGNTLVNNVPRMEGPQSDADRLSYQQQAGRIADPSVPAADKAASIKAIRVLNNKYANYNTPLNTVPTTAVPAMNAADFNVDYRNQSAAMPPAMNAAPTPKQAPDGHFYVPDPNRPGKFLKVD